MTSRRITPQHHFDRSDDTKDKYTNLARFFYKKVTERHNQPHSKEDEDEFCQEILEKVWEESKLHPRTDLEGLRFLSLDELQVRFLIFVLFTL
jgi:hypothetical protein